MRQMLALIALVLNAGALLAQPQPGAGRNGSHFPIERVNEAEAANSFEERLKQLRLHTDVAGLLKQSGGQASILQQMLQNDLGLFNKAREQLKGLDLNDPNLIAMLRQVLKNNGGNQFDAEFLRDLLQQIQNGESPHLGLADVPRLANGDRSALGGSPVTERKPETRSAWARDLTQWLNRLPKDKLAAPLRESPALKQFIRDLAASTSTPGSSLDEQLARWEEAWNGVRDWLPKEWPESLRLHWDSSAISGQLPSLDFSGPEATRAAPVLATLADLLPVLYVAVAGLLVYAVVRLLRRRRHAAAVQWASLGPWPVPPGEIESRSQLVKAFDYLAQLRCGPAAQSWHHRAVAARLPRDGDERQAASELASVYEWARYSPEPGELSPAAAATARRNLAVLAKGAA